MTSKRTNDKFHRLDVKIPVGLYEKISSIALNSFDAKIHHISGKPELSPTLLYLLELGIETFTSGNELIKKSDTDNLTDNIPITNDWVKKLIAQELSPIHSKLDELSELVYRLTNTDKDTDNHGLAVVSNCYQMNEDIVDTDKDTDSFGLLPPILKSTNGLIVSESPLANISKATEDSVRKSPSDDQEIGSYEAAVEIIVGQKMAGKKYVEIARILDEKYYASARGKSTFWEGSLVRRAWKKINPELTELSVNSEHHQKNEPVRGFE